MLYWCGWIVSYLGTFDVSTDICLVSCCLCFNERSFISLSAWDLLVTPKQGEQNAFCNVLRIFPNDEWRYVFGPAIITLIVAVASNVPIFINT